MTVQDRNDQQIGDENSRAIYLRGSILTQYNNGRWIAQRDQDIPVTFRTRIIHQDRSVPIVSDTTRALWTHEYEITFDRAEQNYGYLFSPWIPLELKSLEMESRVGIDPDTRMILLSSQPINSYRVRTSNPEFEELVFDADQTRSEIDRAGITDQISDLADQILVRAGIDPDPETRPMQEDVQAVRAIETHLRTQYSYTLNSEPVPGNQDATEWFLFYRQQGHCEYYASALTLMARSVGVQARVVTGYVAAEYNAVTGSFIVRESNAHAWVEAMVAPDFWRTFDGTPQSDFHDIHEPEPTILRSISKFYEALEHAWVTAVVGYDSDSRDSVFGDLDPNLGLASFANSLQDRFAAGRVQLFRKGLITAGTIFASTMTAGLLLIFLVRVPVMNAMLSRVRSVLAFASIRGPRSRSQLVSLKLQELIIKRLDESGCPCPQGVPLRTHLDTHADLCELELFTPLDQAVGLLYKQQFSKTPHHSLFLEQAKALIDSLQSIR